MAATWWTKGARAPPKTDRGVDVLSCDDSHSGNIDLNSYDYNGCHPYSP